MGTAQAPTVTSEGPVAVLSETYQGPAAEQVIERLQQPDMQDVKAVVSWRGVVVNGDVCLVDLARQYLRLIQEESCGRCGPCRIGVDVMRELFEKLAAGEGGEEIVGQIRDLAECIDDSAWCGIANTIRDPILALLDLGAEHFAEHAAGATCEPRDHPRLDRGPVPVHLPFHSGLRLLHLPGSGRASASGDDHRQARQPAAGDHRPHLSASVRGELHPGADRQAGGHQQHQALVRRPG